ncbi:MAG: hypothetical protein ACO36E_03060 [Synechocystis sp.]
MMFSLLPFKDAFSGGKVHHWHPVATVAFNPGDPRPLGWKGRAPMVIAPMG